MKILIIHNKYKTRFVGGEDVVFQREVTTLENKLGKNNVFKYSVCNDDINFINTFINIWFSKKHYKEVYKIVKENNIDIVHVHNFYPLLTMSIFKAAKDVGAKTIQTLHNYRWWCISGIFYRSNYGICEICSRKKFMWRGIFYKCYRNSYLQSLLTAFVFFFYKITKQDKYIDKFFVLTEFQKNKVLELGINPNKVILKPNFVEKINIQNPIEEKKDFVFVGKMDESKGIMELLEVWKKLDANYQLKLIGSGDLDEEIKKLNLKNVIFLGSKNVNDTIIEIAKSKYLIQSSLMYETFGLTIIEAMTQGTPVIGFNIGTRSDFIKHGKNGFITSPEKLEETIKMAYNYEGYFNLSNNAREFALNYLEENIIEKQINIYKQILNQ